MTEEESKAYWSGVVTALVVIGTNLALYLPERWFG